MAHRISISFVTGLALVVLSVTSGSADSGVFQSAPLSSVGSRPTALEVGDVDGDGSLDVVVTNTGGTRNVVTTGIGFGDGTFVEFRQAEVNVGGLPGELELADFDGDGIDDIAAVNTNEGVAVLLAGGGSRQDVFGDPGPNIPIGGAPIDVTSGDLNGDGDLDLVTSNSETEGSPGTITVLLGAGDLTFTRVDQDPGMDGTQDLVGEIGTSTSVVVDINDDSILDILALNATSETISVFLGDGDGTFDEPSIQAVPGVQHFALGDFDGNGDLDMAGALTNTDRVQVLLGNGDGTFSSHETFRVGSAPIRVAIHDVTGDGELDIVSANSRSQDASVIPGLGGAQFGPVRTYVADAEPRRLAFGDFDEDGLEDIAVVSEGDAGATVATIRGAGDGTFLAAEDLRVDGAPADIGVADIDGNGFADIFGVTNGGEVFVFPSTGADALEPRVTIAVTSGALEAIAVDDIDGDGRLDAAVSDSAAGELALLFGQPDGNLDLSDRIAVGALPQPVALGDFNADGRTDLATALLEDGQVAVRRQRAATGPPTFEPVQLSPSTLTQDRAGPVALQVIDADCNGRDDLVVANNAVETIAVLLSDGDGTFTISNELGTDVVGERPSSLVVGDFDSDGREDFAMSNGLSTSSSAPSIRFFFGRCDGTFETAEEKGFGNPNSENIRAGAVVPAIAARDFSGDQIVDMAGVNQTSNVVGVFLSMGDDEISNGVFVPRNKDVVSRMPEAVAAGDFDADGRYDLVVGNTDASAQNVTVLLNCARDPGCDILGRDPEGMAANRGDANDDGVLTVADIAAVAAEVIDGDGRDVEGVGRGTFPGVPGADSNGDGRVDEQDARAIARRIFSDAAG